MSIPITCAGCNSAFDVPETLAGKTIRCTSCKAQMAVPQAVAAASGKKAAAQQEPLPLDDEPAPAKKSKSAPVKAEAKAATKKAKADVDEDDDEDEKSEKTKPGKSKGEKKSASKSAARKRRDDDENDDDDDDRPTKKGKAKGGNGAMIGIIAAGALGLAAIAGVGIYFATKDDDKKETASSTPAGDSTPTPPPGPSGGSGSRPPRGGKPQMAGDGNPAPAPVGFASPDGGGSSNPSMPVNGGSSKPPGSGGYTPPMPGAGGSAQPPPGAAYGQPMPANGGSSKPPGSGGYTPPMPGAGGSAQPPGGGGFTPPMPGGGGFTPPMPGAGGNPQPPAPGGFTPPGPGMTPPGPGGNFPGPGGMPGRFGGGDTASTDGNSKLRIAPFFTAAFDPENKEFFTLELPPGTTGTKIHGILQHYTYPEFAPKKKYKLERLGFRSAIDPKAGRLYVAVATPTPSARERLELDSAVRSFDRVSVVGDVAVYDLAPIREGKVAEGEELKPIATIPFVKQSIHGLELSDDGKSLYVLTTHPAGAGKKPASAVVVVDTEQNKETKRQALTDLPARDMVKSGDGKSLFILGDTDPKTKQAGVLLFDLASFNSARTATVLRDGIGTIDLAPLADGGAVVTVLTGTAASTGPGGGMNPGGPGAGGPINPIAPGGPGMGGPGGGRTGMGGPGGRPGGGGAQPQYEFRLHLIDASGVEREMDLGTGTHAANGGYVKFDAANKKMFVSSWHAPGVDVYEVTDSGAANGVKLKNSIKTAKRAPVGGHFLISPESKYLVFQNGNVIDTDDVGGAKTADSVSGGQPFPGRPGGGFVPPGQPAAGGFVPPAGGGNAPPGGGGAGRPPRKPPVGPGGPPMGPVPGGVPMGPVPGGVPMIPVPAPGGVPTPPAPGGAPMPPAPGGAPMPATPMPGAPMPEAP